ncbi:hypothetical protein ABGT15_12100 [Flavobacterium enshiense]|uniref:hypothetical protein n=1 Tax=Flavobacterium enshiense TaxID=1341165 RepID=UPI00345D748D
MIKNVSTSEMVLDINHLQFTDEVGVFGLNIEILNRITALNKLNRFCESIKSPFRANTEILFQVIDSILNEKGFPGPELKKYFNARNEIEKIELVSYRVLDFSKFEMPVQAEFAIFGLSYDKYTNISEGEKEALHEAYFELLNEFDSEKIDIDNLINQVTDLLSVFK